MNGNGRVTFTRLIGRHCKLEREQADGVEAGIRQQGQDPFRPQSLGGAIVGKAVV